MITNHAEFKRILNKPGVQLETLALANIVSRGRLHVGQIRPIIKANSVGIYLATPGGGASGSFLDYGKASEWEFAGDVATNVKYGMSYRVIVPSEVCASCGYLIEEQPEQGCADCGLEVSA